jgi:prepilin-type processing-associated H-X9-DG protein
LWIAKLKIERREQMFCPKCGMENPEDAKLCRSCSWVLTSVGPTAPAPDAKTSALAVASLVLGILSFCTFFMTAPLAIILGIVGLFKIEKSQGKLKGRGIAIAGIALPGIALPVIALLMAILMPALAQARFAAQQVVCMSNLKQLGVSTTMYAENNKGQYPTADKWCDLLEPYYKDNNKVLICPATKNKKLGCAIDPNAKNQCSYAINPNAKRDCRFPATTILLFESNPGWDQSGGPELLTTQNHGDKGCNVLFCDGHVEFVRAENINNLRWTAEPAKINP